MKNDLFVVPDSRKMVNAWLYTGLVMVFCMIAIGGITRLTESGLSITEWNVVMGSVPPLSEGAWQEEFDKYKQSPEFRYVNFDFTLNNFKSIYWWEFIHRLWGRLIGLVFFLPFLFFVFRKKLYKKAVYRSLLIFVLGGLQGFIGWYMVQSGLVNEPRVSHYRLALHLITALLTMALIWWLILDINQQGKTSEDHPHRKTFRKWMVGFFVLFFVQLIYGAFVAGLDAGQYFNTWPLMNGKIVGAGSFDQKPFYLNLIGESATEGLNIGGIQFVHRTLAAVLLIYVAVLWFMSRKSQLTRDQRLGINLMIVCIMLQFLLGVLTILMQVPVWLGVMHQLGAVLLMLSSLFTAQRLWESKKAMG